ncbi:MAG: OmpA family protein [Desulfobacterota bacterium]|nr:OmpA family protein [Thermodesulfobacteriota bacterium]
MKAKQLLVVALALFLAAGCSSMSKRTKCACVGAATGAAIGATAGAVIGDMGKSHDNRLGGGIIGGAAGAVIGGVAGYLLCKEEPKPAPPVEAPKPKPVEEKIILNGVQFDFDKAVIKPEYYPVLDEAASILQKHANKNVMIEGHTCSIGTEKYNQKLSERRAAAVKKYLVQKGISAERLMTKGYGESKPIADNKTRQGRKMNRRAELKVIE